jgi:adenosylmethionine-8-amino-7-oxononanoate aminotransferase
MSTLSYDQLRALDARHVWHPFTQVQTAPQPILALGAKGAVVYAADGSEYVDLVSSWWVNLHGHGHPAIAQAVADQALRMEQVIFAEFTHEPAVRLAARVCAALPEPLNRVFYSDDGSTAVEVALKMARQYWSNLGQDRGVFIAFEGGYHGDTVGAMSAGRSSGFFGAWENMLFPVEVVPFPATWNDDGDVEAKEAAALQALERVFEAKAGQIAGVIIEPLIQGAAGMRMCRPQFLKALETKVRQYGTLLILDEVMTGFGRTGDLFACVKAGIVPDLVCLSKGLTGGFLPLSATVATDAIHAAFLDQDIGRAFLHGHSYTANPIGCAAGLASLDLLEAPECRQRILDIAAIHAERLERLTKKMPKLAAPRQCGTVAAFELPGQAYGSAASASLKARFMRRGLLIRPLGGVLYMLPPYCIEDRQLHLAWDVVEEVLTGL